MKKALILLLCSDPVVRMVMKEVLEEAGHVVEASADLGIAVDRLNAATHDLLITQSYIDNITGRDAALYLRTRQNGLRVLIVGGILDDDRLRYRDQLQSFAVFPQPYTAAQLLAKVQEVLARPA